MNALLWTYAVSAIFCYPALMLYIRIAPVRRKNVLELFDGARRPWVKLVTLILCPVLNTLSVLLIGFFALGTYLLERRKKHERPA